MRKVFIKGGIFTNWFQKGLGFKTVNLYITRIKHIKLAPKEMKYLYNMFHLLKLKDGLCVTNKRVATISLSLTEHSHFDNTFPP